MVIIQQISMYMRWYIQLNIGLADDHNVQCHVEIVLCLLNQKCGNSADNNNYNDFSLCLLAINRWRSSGGWPISSIAIAATIEVSSFLKRSINLTLYN